MAKVKRVSVNTRLDGTYASFKAVIDSLESTLFTTSLLDDGARLVLTFKDGSIWTFTYSLDIVWWFVNLTQTTKGGQTSDTVVVSAGSYSTVTLCSSDTFFYIKIDNDGYIVGIYDSLSEDDAILGTCRNIAFTAMPLIHSITGTPYYNQISLNYSAGSSLVHYMNHSNIVSNNIKYFTNHNVYACSTVSADSVITFNGSNYYSISSNHLIPMDMEQDDG